MKRYIKSSINSELSAISRSSINGGNEKELTAQLKVLLQEIPVNRYILCVMDRGYSTGYKKVSPTEFIFLYDNKSVSLDSYWNTKDFYIVLPADFTPSGRIFYGDDLIRIWEITNSDDIVYEGMEDSDDNFLADVDWRYCKELGLYYYMDFISHKMYVEIKL